MLSSNFFWYFDGRRLFLDDGQDFVLSDDQVFHVIDLDFCAGILSHDDGVADLHNQRRNLAVVFDFAAGETYKSQDNR